MSNLDSNEERFVQPGRECESPRVEFGWDGTRTNNQRLRGAEVQKLDWSEIDFDSGYVEFTAAKSKTAKRRRKKILSRIADKALTTT